MGRSFREVALLYLKVLTSVLILDLLTKNLAERFLAERTISLGPFLDLFLIYNKGIAFGLFSEAPDFFRIPLLLIPPVVALFITFFYALKNPSVSNVITMGAIAGGALGNLYDRVFLGKVRDFIHLHAGDLYWPAFNLADTAITLSIVWIIANNLIFKR